jgi:hypothetical protein
LPLPSLEDVVKKISAFMVAVVASGVLFAASAEASTISLVGDIDCFGLTGPCPDGTRWEDDLGGVFFTSNQGPGDPAFTDTWAAPGSFSYTHTYANSPALSAALEIKIAGLHDINQTTVYDLLFNGTSIGAIPNHLGADAFQEVLTYSFVVPIALLTGSDLVSLSGMSGDGFSFDYSQLTIQTQDAAAVPEPASVLLLGSGLVLYRMRRAFRKT